MPYLINVKRLTWVCGHVNPILELSESMLLFKKKQKHERLLQSITKSNVLFHLQTLKCFYFQACPLTFRLVL